MAKTLATVLAACFLALVAAASEVAISKECPYPSLCFSLNIPQNAGKTGRGNVYFQIRAKAEYQWVALGQGRQMADSNMFIVYANGAGKNVTVSPRLGKAHVLPPYSDHAQFSVLEGSGIADGYMTANILCSNCDTWPGGSMDFRRSEADWIYAAKLGEPIHSDDVQRSIHRHDNEGHFSWAMMQAKGSNDHNPFLATESAIVTQPGSAQGGSSPVHPDAYPIGGRARLIAIHGALAALVFVVLFPVGGILIRLANFRGGIWIHVGVQIIAWLAAIAAFGLGIYLAVNMSLLRHAYAHPIIGIILMVLIIGQPVYGWLHHKAFKAHGRRTMWSWAHISIGRIAILGGMINGGLGLKLAGHATRYYLLRYGIVCGIIGAVYIAAIIYGELRLRKVNKGKHAFRKFASEDKQNTLLYARSDEQGLSVPMTQRPFRLRRDDVLHRTSDSTEYVPLAGRELYADEAGSRAGSRAASPAPRSRAASPESRSRATSATRLGGNTAYDP